jgi:hypothetical protein
MLHNDGHVRLGQRRIIGVAWDGFEVGEIGEAKMEGALRCHDGTVGTRGVAILEENGRLDMGFSGSDIQNTRGLVALHLRRWSMAPAR